MLEDIKYWLEEYVDKEDLPGVAGAIHHIAWKHSKTSFAIGLVMGFMGAVIILKYFG